MWYIRKITFCLNNLFPINSYWSYEMHIRQKMMLPPGCLYMGYNHLSSCY